MSEVIEVDSGWLALREAEDARARSSRLARAASLALASGPITVHDLGSGTGSMMRWLAPMLPGPQAWVLHDWNPALTAHAAGARAPLDRDGRAVSIDTRGGRLAQLGAEDLAGASLVTASALLDVLTLEEVDAIAGACIAVRSPALFSLSVSGDVRLRPDDPMDAAIEAAFNAHQGRVVDGRRMLGPAGADVAIARFERAGWRVRAERTTWQLDGRDPLLLEQWFDGWIGAASEQVPELDLADCRTARAEQQRAGVLAAVIGHTDLLATPR